LSDLARGLFAILFLSALVAGSGGRSSAKPTPPVATAEPVGDAQAERIFERAQEIWRDRQESPYVSYGALQVYKHDGKSFSDWWLEYYRNSDRRLIVKRVIDPDEDRKRLKGFPISIFVFKIADTNPDFPPIHVDDPIVEPFDSFGMGGGGSEPAPMPSVVIGPITPNEPTPSETPLREIGRVETESRVYDVRLVGTEQVGQATDYHLTLTPLRDPKINRLRELWIDAATYATDKLVVAGIYNGQPYNAVRWLVTYTTFDRRQYVQQIKNEDPLHFGLDTIIPDLEIDFVDYRFDAVPSYIFDGMGF